MRLSTVMTGLFCVASSAAFALPKTPEFDTASFAKIKNKTVTEFFCAQPTTYQVKTACDDLKKSKNITNTKIDTLEFDTKSSFTLRMGAASVKVSRTMDPHIYQVNHRKIDLNDYADILALQEAIANTLPKFSKYSLLINSASAQAGPEFGEWGQKREVARAIAMMMLATSDGSICKSASDVTKLCQTYPQNTVGAKNLDGITRKIRERMTKQAQKTPKTVEESLSPGGMTKAERAEFDAALASFNKELNNLHTELAIVNAKRTEVLRLCPATPGSVNKSALQDLNQCYSSLKDSQTETQKISAEALKELRGTDDDLAILLRAESVLSTPVKSPESKTGTRR